MVSRCGPAATMVTDVTKSGHASLLQGYCPAARISIRRRRTRPELCSSGASERCSRTVLKVPRFVVDVMLKPEIHDPQGEAIASACRRLGFGQVAGVRQGKRFEIELSEPASPERVGELAAELLANPVIEEFSVRPL
jgi:phosphoribosylformylglycinamidine synthase subunit PurS